MPVFSSIVFEWSHLYVPFGLQAPIIVDLLLILQHIPPLAIDMI